jgi:hypothetical protein
VKTRLTEYFDGQQWMPGLELEMELSTKYCQVSSSSVKTTPNSSRGTPIAGKACPGPLKA